MSAVISSARSTDAPRLAPGEVHVWRIDLAGAVRPDAAGCLADNEVSRASRFAFERDRRRYVRTRCALREVLARYLGLRPAEVPIGYGAHGKPRLAARAALGFNVSHSGERALIAIGRQSCLGIDIEMIDRSRVSPELSRDVFTPAEATEVHSGSESAAIAFFTCWTRKEAYLKALGLGLTIEPREVHVGAGADRRDVWAVDRRAHVEVTTLFRDDTAAAALAVVGGFTEATLLDL